MPDAVTRSSKFRLKNKPLGLKDIHALRDLVSTDEALDAIDFSSNSKTVLVKPAPNAGTGENIFSAIKGYLTKQGFSFEYSILPECVLQSSQAG